MSEPDALLHDFQSITEPLRLEELFTQPQPTELEIGCGDGGFLFEYAQRHPERNFLGVERLLGRVRKLSKRGQHAGLNNLRLLRIEARYVLDYLLPERAFCAAIASANATDIYDAQVPNTPTSQTTSSASMATARVTAPNR